MRISLIHGAMLAVAVSLAACSADSNPLAPSVPSLARSEQKNAADTKSKHIHGRLQTTESGTLAPGTPIMLRHLEGTGNASHLGRFTVVGDITLNLATASGFGTGVYTAANGDMLTYSATGQAVIANGIATVTETVTITGGTGRFDGATGTLTVVRSVVQATGVASGTIDGTITMPK